MGGGERERGYHWFCGGGGETAARVCAGGDWGVRVPRRGMMEAEGRFLAYFGSVRIFAANLWVSYSSVEIIFPFFLDNPLVFEGQF